MNNMIYLPLTRSQAKLLLKLLDAFTVVFGSEVPIQISGIRNRLNEVMFPDAGR